MVLKTTFLRRSILCLLAKTKSQKKCWKKRFSATMRKIAYAKTEGVDLTKEEAEAYLDELSECELKDGDLKHVAGGASDTHECGDLKAPY